MSFLKTISYIISSELDRTLICLLDDNQDAYLDEKSYYKLLEMVLGQNPRYSKNVALEAFLRSIQKQSNWQGSLRHLMIFHKLTHDLGEECFQWIASDKIQHLYNYKTQGLTIKMFVHKAMVSYYHNYLKKLSHNYEDLSMCFHFDEQYQAKLMQNNISPLHSLSKLQNILRYLIHIFSLFDASLIDFKPCLLVKQVTYFCFTDCYHYYTYINKIISSLLKDFFILSTEDAIQLYEIYSEHIIITRKLKPLFALGFQLPEFTFKVPDFFVLDSQYNTKIELYVASLRGQSPKLTREFSQIITAPDVSVIKEGHDDSILTTKEVSRVIAEAISVNTETSAYKKNLFEPPNVPQRNKPAHPLPKLRIVKANAIVPWSQPGQNVNVRESIDCQKTRVSFSSNVKLDASTQFENGGLGNTFLQNSMEQQSAYPLTQNESFMREDNARGNSARAHIQNVY